MKRLQSGTMSGSEAEIKALGNVTGPLYHYSKNADAIRHMGFLGGASRSQGDGIYFMNSPETLQGWLEGNPVLKAYIVGNVVNTSDVRIPEDKMEDVQDEFGTTDVSELMEAGTLGNFLRYLGYDGWTDGYQYAALKPSAIAIVQEPSESVTPEMLVNVLLSEALPGLKVNVHFQLGDGIEDILPGLVSREIKPDDLKFGNMRLTVFSKPRKPSAYGLMHDGAYVGEKVPIGHVTFDHEGPVSAKSAESAILKAGEFSRLVTYYNESPYSDTKANTASIEP